MSCDFLPLMHTAIVTSGSVSVSLSLLSGMFTLSSLMTTEARLSLSLSLFPLSLTHACMHVRGRIWQTYRMSSSLSGKLQKAILSWIGSGIGSGKCSTTSNGIQHATALADSSASGQTCRSEHKKIVCSSLIALCSTISHHDNYVHNYQHIQGG